MRYANYAVTSTCPTGCCYQPCGGTLDEYQDGTLLAGGAVGWLANGEHTYRIDNITQVYCDLSVISQQVATVDYPSVSKNFSVDNDSPLLNISYPQDGITVSTMAASVTVGVTDQLSGLETINFRLTSGDYHAAGMSGSCGLKKTLTGAVADPHEAYESSVTYCSSRLEVFLGTAPFCNESFGAILDYSKTYDLRDYIDFSDERDCEVKFSAIAVDKVGYSTGIAGPMEVRFIVDQAPPEIHISSWPEVLPHGPITRIAGTVADSSEVQILELSLRQLDWSGATTYWDGAAWSLTQTPVMLDIPIPAGANTLNWVYDELLPKDIASGSRYLLTVKSFDKFGHKGVLEKDFFYNACTSSYPYASTYNGDDIFEVGTALFRELDIKGLATLGHMGLYIVSDSQYVINNGGSTTTFMQRLIANNGRLLPLLRTDAAHFVVHAVPEGVLYASAAGFMSTPYWGAYEGKNLDPLVRDKIAFFASLQLGKPYADMGAEQAFLPIGPDWAGPDRFRCDGLAVYAYSQAGRDAAVAAHSSPREDFPLDLAHLWVPVKSSVPAVSDLRISFAGDVFNITAQAADDESGIDRVDYFLRTHPTVGHTEFLGTVDNDSRPIIVDQPEENLDNRSVYSTLVKFFRKAKHQRQIIVVTHNPNLVVNGDSEQVIVANFERTASTQPARIRYVAGAIENSSPFDKTKTNVLDSQGIREHVCEILEGGRDAFAAREQKYGFQRGRVGG